MTSAGFDTIDGAQHALPIPRATVETIVARRNRTLELYAEAFGSWGTATEAMREAHRTAGTFARKNGRFNYHVGEDQRKFFAVTEIPEAEAFTEHVRRIVDTDVWGHIVEMTTLERLMDAKAKQEMHRQLVENPPEVTTDNVYATLEQFMLDADMIWKRGIATCFSNLDRKFRSHDGWKVGSRIILTYALNNWGSWCHHRAGEDTLTDIERAFLVLDGKSPTSQYVGIVHQIDQDRRGGWGEARQSESDSDYFKVRCFKNGNAHVWFKRDDLVEKVNQLLGEYYGAPIPEDREPDADDGLDLFKTSLAKNYGFFPTPDAAADEVVDKLSLWRDAGDPPLTVLEPSAGTGSLARRCIKPLEDEEWRRRRGTQSGAIVDCIEVHAARAADLRAARLYRRVTNADFLAVQPDPARLYDRVVMNPPFDRERDIDHVMHALKFLKEGGQLVAVMSAGTEFRETRKSTAFRELMAKMKAEWRDLPPGSFASVGTYCNTIILNVWKK